MIRAFFPPYFRRSQYISLQMSGKLDGSINVSAPACYNVKVEKDLLMMSLLLHTQRMVILFYLLLEVELE